MHAQFLMKQGQNGPQERSKLKKERQTTIDKQDEDRKKILNINNYSR